MHTMVLLQLLKFVMWEHNIEIYFKIISFDIFIMQWSLKYINVYTAMENVSRTTN